MWPLLAWLNPVVIPGLSAGTCAVLRGSLLIVCKCVYHLSNKELLYFLLLVSRILINFFTFLICKFVVIFIILTSAINQSLTFILHCCCISLIVSVIVDLIGLKPNPWGLSSFSALTLLVGLFDP